MQNITSPRTDDSGIEQEIQQKGLTAARVTPKDIEDNIASTWYINAGEGVVPDDYMPPVPANHPLRLLTFCVFVLKLGSASLNEFPSIFNKEFRFSEETNKFLLLFL